MAEFKLIAETRTEFGKGARAGSAAPADPRRPVRPRHRRRSTSPCPARDAARAQGAATPCSTLVLDGKDQLALTKDVQRDPIRSIIEHVDLVLVRRGEKITVEVPVRRG